MRTQYPVPSFADNYQYKLVDSTFIHAIHLAKSKGNWTYSLGVSFQDNQDEIKWYIVNDPVGLYKKLTDPTKSPGFTFNNSVKGKQYTTAPVVDKQPSKPSSLQKNLDTIKENMERKLFSGKEEEELLAAFYEKLRAKQKESPKVEFVSTYGPLLDTAQKTSSCIGYLALGFNKTTKGFVIYYALKTKPHDVYAIETDDANVYRDWISSESLGKYFNRWIKGMNRVLLKSRVASA